MDSLKKRLNDYLYLEFGLESKEFVAITFELEPGTSAFGISLDLCTRSHRPLDDETRLAETLPTIVTFVSAKRHFDPDEILTPGQGIF